MKTRKLVKLFFLFLMIYLLAVLYSVKIVSDNSSMQFMLEMMARHQTNGCDSNYKKIEANLFNPFQIYVNPNYWLADYRVSLSSFSSEKCAMDIFMEMKKYKTNVTTAVVDENSNVIFYIESIK